MHTLHAEDLPVSGGQLALVMAEVTTTNHCGQNTGYSEQASQSIYSYVHIKYILLVRTPVTKNKFRGSLGFCYNETPLYIFIKYYIFYLHNIVLYKSYLEILDEYYL